MEMGGAENSEKTNTLFRLSPQKTSAITLNSTIGQKYTKDKFACQVFLFSHTKPLAGSIVLD